MNFDKLSADILSEKLIKIQPNALTEIKNYISEVYRILQDKMVTNYRFYAPDKVRFFPEYDSEFTIQLNNFGQKFKKEILVKLSFYYDPKSKIIAEYNMLQNCVWINIIHPLSVILNQAIEHELIHAIQFGGFVDSDKKIHGFPKQRIRSSKTYQTHQTFPHVQRDIEYFPNLNTFYQQIKSKLPPNFTNKDVLFQIRNNLKLNYLKELSPLKWQNAVKMIYQALKDDSDSSLKT